LSVFLCRDAVDLCFWRKDKENRRVGERKGNKKLQWNGGSPPRRMIDFVSKLLF
jgi:hypothetical protein